MSEYTEQRLEDIRVEKSRSYKIGHRPKGTPKTGGRLKGSKNKFTRQAKDHFVEAFENSGGSRALTNWAMDNRDDFYKLYARLIPQEREIAGPNKGAIKVQAEVEFVKA